MNTTELRSVLGLSIVYRRSESDFARIVNILNVVAKNEAPKSSHSKEDYRVF